MKLVNTHILIVFIALLALPSKSIHAQAWTLQQCLDTAKVNNKNLQLGKNNLAIATEKHQEAKAGLLPKISANADYKYFTNMPYQLLPLSTFNAMAPQGQFKEAQFGVQHNINANLQFLMPLYNAQIYGAIEATKLAGEITNLQYQKSEEQVLFEVTTLYYNAQILQHQILFIDSNLSNAKKLLANMELLNQQLLAKVSDVNKVRLQVAQLTTQNENLTSKNKQILNALKLFMGLSLSQELAIDNNIDFKQMANYKNASTIEQKLIETNAILIKNEIKTLNKTRFLPNLNLYGTYGTNGFGYDKQPNEFLKFYPIGFAGVQVSYPIFSGTTTQRKLNQKRIEQKNVALQLSFQVDQNNAQIENALMQRQVSQNTVKTIAQQVELAREIYHQTILMQKEGTANLTDVLLADNAIRESQQNYLNALVEYLKSDLELKRVSGNLKF